MADTCKQCRSTNIGGGSWIPNRCLHCGAIEGGEIWYYDKDARPTTEEIREKSGYPNHRHMNEMVFKENNLSRIN